MASARYTDRFMSYVGYGPSVPRDLRLCAVSSVGAWSWLLQAAVILGRLCLPVSCPGVSHTNTSPSVWSRSRAVWGVCTFPVLILLMGYTAPGPRTSPRCVYVMYVSRAALPT